MTGISFEVVMLAIAALAIVLLVATRDESDDERWRRLRRDMKRSLLNRKGMR